MAKFHNRAACLKLSEFLCQNLTDVAGAFDNLSVFVTVYEEIRNHDTVNQHKEVRS